MKNNKYELMLILDPEKSESDLLKELELTLSEFGFKVIDKDAWGLRTLAYPIKKSVQGRYVIYDLESREENQVLDATREISINNGVLRHKFFLIGGE